MEAALLSGPHEALAAELTHVVTPEEFRALLVSHRRMVRVDRRESRQRGLQDLDTGEIFLTDERRLVEYPR
jgi:hypothetical protein